ncbi:hypothetical protein PV726_48310 [Streptomyces europaeiscabiei]|uniref:hypothetical protein n=1 Tax=Streptomyces europaeiscabiei TaxID=146819 RepID=UPI0029A99A4C|nr:hypothetical protein [Streptomyces europaeiscabiei]MDX3697836.1 hypothetical protein [Streptomyces europaeiscabiei]
MRDVSLRTSTAGELRSWLAGQDDVADASVHPDTPAGTVSVRLADGLLMAVTVSTDNRLPAPAAGAAAHQQLAERIRTWLAGESGLDQVWSIPSTTALGADLVDGTEFTIIVSAGT